MRKDSFTIIIMRHMGKVRSFEIKRKRFFTSIALLVCFILVSTYFSYAYFITHHERRQLLNTIEKLESDVRNLNDEIKGNEEYKKWSRKVFSSLMDSVEIEEADRVSGEGGAVVSPDAEVSKMAVRPTSKVSIKNFKVKSDKSAPNMINFTFTILNNQENHEQIAGYIATIGRNGDTEPAILGTYPRLEMRDGIPVNHKQGQYFAIKYQKPIKGRIEKPEGDRRFKEVIALVYSVEGKLMLKKTLKLDEE